MEVEVVYEGVLELGFNPESTTSRDWKPRLFVLKHDPKTKRSTLDFYKDTKKRWQKQVAKGLISLWPSFRLSLAHGSSYKFPIKLITSDGQTFCLAAQDFQMMNTWFTHIQNQLTLDNLFPDKKGCREYTVQVVETDSAKLIGARGDCVLVLSKGHFYLALSSSQKVVGVWPYNSLRRYYCIEETFGFVAGRRSPRGEGEFKFITSQKEDIYHRLERAILRAKRGSEGSTSSAEGGKDVDNRPPAPLPSAQEPPQSPRQETPVPTSESDEDIFQSDPDPRSVSPGVRSMKQLMSAPVSDIHPAYGKFNSEGGGARGRSGRVQPSMWLHESVSVVPQPQESSNKKKYHQSSEITSKRPPLPPSRNSQISMVPVASEEDTYSHTVHPVPEQFRNKTIEHNVIGGNVYNALVHQNSQQSLLGRNSRPSSEADLYDVAFPEGRRVISSGDYAVARHPDVPQYPPGVSKLPPRRVVSANKLQPGRDMTDGGTQSQEAKKPPAPSSPTAASSTARGERKSSDDGLTPNPLYGSQDQLLSDIAILDELTREMELGNSSFPEVSDQPTSIGAAAVPLPDLMDLDEADQQFTTNPVYGEMTAEQKQRLMQERANLVSHAEGNVTTLREEERERETEMSGKGETQNLAHSSQQSGTTTASPEQLSQTEAASSDDGIQRDAKGYSKIDKSKKTSGGASRGGEGDTESHKGDVEDGGSCAAAVPHLESQGSSEDANGSPPPLPERNYSFDESELNKPPIAGRGSDHES